MNPAGEGRNAEQKDKADAVRKQTVDLLIALGMGEREAEMREFQKLRQRPLESSDDAGGWRGRRGVLGRDAPVRPDVPGQPSPG